jgi:hypothetical protein
MYSYGLVKFLQAKKLKSAEAINSFLKSEGITNYTAKHHHRVNSYIQKNWTKFATFIDKEIKNGNLKGSAVKLNHYYDEQREYKNEVRNEFVNANLTVDQEMLLNYIKEYGVGSVHSFLNKKGIIGLGKDPNYKSKKLQWLPVVNKAIENGIDIDALYQAKQFNSESEMLPAIPPTDYKGSQADWMIKLQERGLWDGENPDWHGDVIIPAKVWWEILEECEGPDDEMEGIPFDNDEEQFPDQSHESYTEPGQTHDDEMP